jgi:NAD(P)-dependent dehydrogenase (short-subunit alcohol dehydrogenase family)
VSTLDGAVTVVTGGAGGVGSALAREAAQRGSNIVIADIADGSGVVEELRALGVQAEWFKADVASYDSVVELAQYTKDTFGGANVLVNCAVAGVVGPLQSIPDPERARPSFDVSIIGYFFAIRAFAEALLASAANNQPAHILNVGSEHSFGVPPHVPASSLYTVSKYAAMGITDVARRDFDGTGVSVTLFAPGWVGTPKVRQIARDSEEYGALIRPYVQSPEYVAKRAFEGLLNKEYIVFPNPKSAGFALEHAQQLIAEIERGVEQSTAVPDTELWTVI